MTTKNYSLGKLLTHPSVVVCSDTMRIWAFGGGKGGIGKSFLCTNLAVCLAQLGQKVIIVDLDLTYFCIKIPFCMDFI